MRPHPVVTYLRFAGLAVGLVLFVFMAHRASQMANSKIAVQGQPRLQAVQSAGSSDRLSATNPSAFSTVSAVVVTQPSDTAGGNTGKAQPAANPQSPSEAAQNGGSSDDVDSTHYAQPAKSTSGQQHGKAHAK